jgi:hypothetical protein
VNPDYKKNEKFTGKIKSVTVETKPVKKW